MACRVLLTDSAARDLEELDVYITQDDSPEKAEYVLGKIEDGIDNLSEFPERGAYPQELLTLRIREYRGC